MATAELDPENIFELVGQMTSRARSVCRSSLFNAAFRPAQCWCVESSGAIRPVSRWSQAVGDFLQIRDPEPG